MDAFDREARVWSPVWSPEEDQGSSRCAAGLSSADGGKEEGAAAVDLVTMQW